MIQHSFKRQPVIYLILLLTMVVSVSRAAIDEESELPFVQIPKVENLQISARNAASACKPLLLEFSASYCSYCRLLEEEVLKPILRNRDYDSRALIQKVKLDNYLSFTNFTGNKTDATALAKRYRISVTPTLLFLDEAGNEIAERMVGVNSLDYFAAYLDENIDSALSVLAKGEYCDNT